MVQAPVCQSLGPVGEGEGAQGPGLFLNTVGPVYSLPASQSCSMPRTSQEPLRLNLALPFLIVPQKQLLLVLKVALSGVCRQHPLVFPRFLGAVETGQVPPSDFRGARDPACSQGLDLSG